LSSVYLDASAVVKLFKPEPETAKLQVALGAQTTWTSSELVVVEALCSARRLGIGSLGDAKEALSNIELLGYSKAICDRAGSAFSRSLTALDAIHAATALSVREDLDAVYVYDAELASALVAEGLTVASPGA
jgi:predicted nucleic acid-binding protein